MEKIGGMWKISERKLKAWLRKFGPKGINVDLKDHRMAAEAVQDLEDLAPRIQTLGQPEWSRVLEDIKVLIERDLAANGGPLKTATASPENED